MRTPIEVLEQVHESLPENIKNEYNDELNSIKSSIEFSSPENKGYHIHRFMDLFNQIIGYEPLTKESEDWKHKTLAIYMGDISDTTEETRKKVENGEY